MNVFDLQAKIGINTTEYKKGLSEASKEFSEFGGKVKDGAAKLAKISTAALGAAAAGVTALVKQSVSAYAEYEQLVGGIETLFGNSAKKVLENANKAFATAGMSANEYMETSIQGAAALINSLGGDTEKAAELMDISIQDMSDNVNKMGTTMESIQNAYRGFSRGNFTMLDNLSLGFAGTKDGMEKLLEKAHELSGIDYNIESYADIVQAIHVVQQAMGITGTTAKEAAGTITGSMSSVKAAWKNLTVEMAKSDGDVSKAFTILGDNVGAVVENMLPRVEQALGGVGDLIAAASPQVIDGMKRLLPKVLPSLIKTAGSLVSTVGQAVLSAVPELLDVGRNLLANLAYGMENSSINGGGIIGTLLDSIVNNAPYYFQYAQMILSNLADQLLNADYGKLGSSFSKVFISAVNSITDFFKNVDFYKVGENIADFINAIDWQNVANTLLDCIAAGLKGLGDIAVSFFANADLGNLMTMIGVLSAPKLLGGITDYMKSSEGQSLGQSAGESWSGAFMAGIKAFGLGWAIGTWIRDNVEIGGKTIGEWADEGVEKSVGAAAYTALTSDFSDNDSNTFTYTNKYGKKVQALISDGSGNYTEAYKKYLAAQDKGYQDKTFTYYQNGGKHTGYVYDSFGNYTAEYEKYGNIPKYGDGGRVTRPTLAIVGEKEPETIVPDSKRGQLGNVTYNVTFNVDGYSIKDDASFIEQMSRKLEELRIKQSRAMGGAAW